MYHVVRSVFVCEKWVCMSIEYDSGWIGEQVIFSRNSIKRMLRIMTKNRVPFESLFSEKQKSDRLASLKLQTSDCPSKHRRSRARCMSTSSPWGSSWQRGAARARRRQGTQTLRSGKSLTVPSTSKTINTVCILVQLHLDLYLNPQF